MSGSWHGYTYKEWVDLWDSVGWRDYIEEVLYEAASCRKLKHKHRMQALNLINISIHHRILEADDKFPAFMRDVMLEEVAGVHERTGGRAARKLLRRLKAAQWMIHTALQWFQALQYEKSLKETAEKPPQPQGPN